MPVCVVCVWAGGWGLGGSQHSNLNQRGPCMHATRKRDVVLERALAGPPSLALVVVLWVLEGTEAPRTTDTTQADSGFG